MNTDEELSYREYIMRESDEFHAPYNPEFEFYSAVRISDIEKVAERALRYGVTRYRSIKVMLEKDLSDEEPRHKAPLSDLGQRFLRSPDYFGREVRHG